MVQKHVGTIHLSNRSPWRVVLVCWALNEAVGLDACLAADQTNVFMSSSNPVEIVIGQGQHSSSVDLAQEIPEEWA